MMWTSTTTMQATAMATSILVGLDNDDELWHKFSLRICSKLTLTQVLEDQPSLLTGRWRLMNHDKYYFFILNKIFDLNKDMVKPRITDIPRINDGFMRSNFKLKKIKRMPIGSRKNKWNKLRKWFSTSMHSHEPFNFRFAG